MQAAWPRSTGRVGVLINNAGYSQSGALETLPMDAVRRQFETNVFGLLRLTQLVLPGMRAAGEGKIVNVSLDGRAADLPGRRRLPRHQVRGRGAQRRAADGGRALRDRRHLHRAGPDPHRVRRDRRGRASEADDGDPYADFNARGGEVHARRLRGAAVAARRRRRRRRPRDREGAGEAARAHARPGHRLRARCSWACAACSPTAPGTASSARASAADVDLQRFVDAQDPIYERVLAELRAGRKTSHWMWFVFPQIAGLGRSPTARALRDLRPRRGPRLPRPPGARRRGCASARRLLLDHSGLTAFDIFGGIDAIKLRSSMTLFARAADDRRSAVRDRTSTAT